MTVENYDDVLRQLCAAGLEVEALELGRIMRVRTHEDRGRDKTGWYILHELTVGRRHLLVGAYGDWRQHDPRTGDRVNHKISLDGAGVSLEEHAAVRAQLADDRRRAEAKRIHVAERAALRARTLWERSSPVGSCAYLVRKGVQAFGVRFTERGNLLIPMSDEHGTIHGLQVIYGDSEVTRRKGRDKDYWPAGLAKRGRFFLLGEPNGIILMAEGYATAASLHEATRLPVAIAFDAGNLAPAGHVLKRAHSAAQLLFCADDDFRTSGNPGISAATVAADGVRGAWLAPVFADRGDRKLTDFNDLHQAEGLQIVRGQVQKKLQELGWDKTVSNTAQEEKSMTKAKVVNLPTTKRKKRNASGSGSDAQDDDRPIIKIKNGELPHILDQADAALGAWDPTVFAQDGRLVRVMAIESDGHEHDIHRPAGAITMQTVVPAHLVDRLALAAKWQKFNARTDEWRPADVPRPIADSFIARNGGWKHIRQLRGIVQAPTLRADGTVLDAPGYDAGSGIYLAGELPKDYSAPHAQPNREEGLYALDEIWDALRDFPFVDASDRAAAIAGILTSLFRRSLPAAPMVSITAPTAGTGKTLLVDVSAVIATGRRAPVLSLGDDQTESEKRLASALLAGDSLINLDNIERPLYGDFLNQILTQPIASIRPLGASAKLNIQTNCSFFATGNALDMRGDLKRRVLLIRLDAKVERPEQRRFNRDVLQYVSKHRGELIRAALTITRAYLVADTPDVGTTPFGSFERWDAWCRRPLVWLGLPDPLLGAEDVRGEDPDITTQRQLFAAWFRLHSENPVTAGTMAQEAQNAGSDNELHEAMLSACGEKITAKRFGNWLRRHRGRVIDGRRLEACGIDSHSKVARWRLVEVAGSAGTAGSVSPYA